MKEFPLKSEGFHPFGEMIGLEFSELYDGGSRCMLAVSESLYNPHRVLHGGVLYTMADTGMGAALYTLLDERELCSTVEVKITYFQPVKSGRLTCETRVVNRTKRLAYLESEIENDGRPVARASGTFFIFPVS